MTTDATTSVVVTGMGVVTPAGTSLEDFWDAQLQANSLAEMHYDPAGKEPPFLACRVSGLEAESAGLTAKAARRLDPFALFGCSAGRSAWLDAGSPEVNPARAAVVVGNAVGGRTVSDAQASRYARRGAKAVNPMMPIMTMPNAAAAQIAIQLGWTGPALTVATTCASGADAVGLAVSLLESGRYDIVLAGGCEATLSPVTLAAFSGLGAMSNRHEDPTAACRPFDADRDGFVMGEGAGFVVLEREADARNRGARARAKILGYCSTSDAHHMTMPDEQGRGAMAAMEGALEQAGVLAGELRFVNAHGTSTPLNDRAEGLAIAKVVGCDTPVTSTKGVVGHLIGAGGAVELIATVQAINNRLVPPTANFCTPDPFIDISVVGDQPIPIDPGPALTNSFGFGGHNAALVVAPV